MPTIIAVAGLAASAVGAGMTIDAQKKASKAQNQAIAVQNQANAKIASLSKRQEKVRKNTMNLEALRQQRAVMRQAQLARAMALNSAANTGSLMGSGLQGVFGSIFGQAGVQSTAINANQAAGNTMFGLNAQMTDIQSAANSSVAGFQSQVNSFNSTINTGQSLFQMGAGMVNSSQTAGNVFDTLFNGKKSS